MLDQIEPMLVSRPPAVLIAGPTASGKSALASALARRHGGVVINADSMQVYAELAVVSARPTDGEERCAPHRLYGHVPAKTRYSVGRWLEDAARVMAETGESGALPIFVGGTGLYFRALSEGLAPVPSIPAGLRARLAEAQRNVTTEALHAALAERDPQGAAAIRPSDRARICRALEVFEATGRPLAAWQSEQAGPALVPEAARVVIAPQRAGLHARISARADAMVEAGALDEVRALVALGLDPDLPAMKAIGVRPLRDHLAGEISIDEAVVRLKTETRRYAKRQETWFRHQMPDWRRIEMKPA